MGDRRAQRQGRVGDASGDHHLRTLLQCVGDLEGALVHIGADELAARARGGKEGPQERLAFWTGEVIAFDDRDARPRQALFPGDAQDVPCRSARIGAAEIADDRNPVPQAVAQDGTDLLIEKRVVAGLRVGPLGELREGQRTLG